MKSFIRLKRTPLKLKSDKQKQRDVEWHKAKYSKCVFLENIYGAPICEYCGRPSWGNEFGILDAHHLDHNRRNNTKENCYICHRVCHGKITDNNLKVKCLGFEGIIKGADDGYRD